MRSSSSARAFSSIGLRGSSWLSTSHKSSRWSHELNLSEYVDLRRNASAYLRTILRAAAVLFSSVSATMS
jgi:hypothetical protein